MSPLSAQLSEELKSMYDKDQAVRWEVIHSGKLNSEEGIRMMEEIDRNNLPRLKAILDEYGWPGIKLVGEAGADQMWLLVQHSDHDVEFQKRALALLKGSVDKNDAPKRHLAYLTDRVLLNEGKEQIYGTQMEIVNGQVILQPVQDPDHLDQRREEIGLCPIAEYLLQLKQMYQLEKYPDTN
jgi:hypothetical protein